MDRQVAEMGGKLHLLLGGDILVFEHQEFVRVERVPDFSGFNAADAIGNANSADFSADIRPKGCNFDALLGCVLLHVS